MPGSRRLSTVVAFVLAAGTLMGATASSASEPPTLRLFAASSTITAERFGPNEKVYFDPGAYLTAVGGNFEIRVSRAGYANPIRGEQIVGSESVPLPESLGVGWDGFTRFLRVDVTRNADGSHTTRHTTWCPNDFEPQRLDPESSESSTYPQFCGSNPFTLGTVWGIDAGWAVNPFNAGGIVVIKGPDGRYAVTLTVTKPYRTAFGISDADASVTVNVKVKTVASDCPPVCENGGTAHAAGARGLTSAPTVADPDPASLPDLRPLPAWGMSVDRDEATGDDFLSFGATVWNRGPAPLTVEGFRRPGTGVMDAYQYFYRDGQVVGRARAGTMLYDARPGHEHWHFKQFATYTLLDASKQSIVRSEKEAFCLAPTDAIDLAVPGAIWRPDAIGLHTICGWQTSIWVRETLPAGWGDTYFQGLPGQSFDVSGLPNGTYFIEVTANPTGRLHESNVRNNTELRRVILGGRPGHRTVTVPPWHGIDTG
jgi:hypothetical protein